MKKLLSLIFVTAAIFALTMLAFAAGDTFTNPVANGADPFIFKDDDGTYYLYATNSNDFGFRTYSSRNLIEWTAEGHCLTEDGIFVDETRDGGDLYDFWAPEVMKYNGKYYMIFSFKSEEGLKSRFNVAVADSPKGPFKSATNKYLFPYQSAIDGHFFLDDDGKMYLYFSTGAQIRSDIPQVPSGSHVWGCEFDMETLSVKEGTEKLLVTSDPKYEKSALVAEGPYMLKNEGKYFLTFSSGDWRAVDYSVCVATSDSPLGTFVRDGKGEIFASDDQDYADNKNPHLYGTAHHSFVEAPNGKDLLIVYHCHRNNGISWGENENPATPRSTCLDYAWFEDGKLYAGSKENPGVPTATPQPLFEGTTLERQTYLTGAFEKIPSLPTVYVASYDGSDDNPGTKEAPVKTINKAIGILKKGGTLVLTQNAKASGHIDLTTTRGPVLITAEHNNVVLEFGYLSINSSVYIDNIILSPIAEDNVSVIECNFNNVVIGEGVSCLDTPRTDSAYPYLVGGRWLNNNGDISAFKHSADMLTSEKEYTLTVLGGKWEMVELGSVDYKTPIENSAPNGKLMRDASLLTPTPDAPVATKTEIKMTIGSSIAYVNGETKVLDAAPINRSSRTMLPVRFLAENLGATVEWDDATKTATLKDATTTIAITIGASSMTVNGADVALDSPALIENSRTYLPLRAIANALGVSNDNITWDDSTKTATLVK